MTKRSVFVKWTLLPIFVVTTAAAACGGAGLGKTGTGGTTVTAGTTGTAGGMRWTPIFGPKRAASKEESAPLVFG